MLLVLRSADGSDQDAVSDLTGLFCADKSLTKQEFLEESDINTIIRRFGVGYEPPMNVHVPMNGDFTDALDFRESLDLVREADEAFMTMSAEVRKRFHHDPVEFVEFVSDASNLEEARKLGIAVLAPVVLPPAVAPVSPPVVAQ